MDYKSIQAALTACHPSWTIRKVPLCGHLTNPHACPKIRLVVASYRSLLF